jgi:hypothetical protein
MELGRDTPAENPRGVHLASAAAGARAMDPGHTDGGDIDALLPPVQTAGQAPARGPAAALGQHTEAVRAEFETPG